MKALILDVDWAPDFVIDDVVKILETYRVKATWFITHNSPILDKLQRMDALFELGIHPNFLPGTTHGNTHEEIIDHCLSIVKDANCIRSHAYSQSSLLYKFIAENTGLNIDASVFAPHTPDLRVIKYFVGNRYLYRVPVYWEDSNEMKIPDIQWEFNNLPVSEKGLQVFAFHPIHIYLNTFNISQYRELRVDFPDLLHADPAMLMAERQSAQRGVRDFFIEFVQSMSEEQGSLTLSELVEKNRTTLA